MALMRTLIAAGLKRGRRSFVGIFLLMTLTGAALTFTVSMYVDLNAREEAEALLSADPTLAGTLSTWRRISTATWRMRSRRCPRFPRRA